MWPLDWEPITKTSTVAACCSSLQVTNRVGGVLSTVPLSSSSFYCLSCWTTTGPYHFLLVLETSTKLVLSSSIPLSFQSPYLSWCVENVQIKYQPPFFNFQVFQWPPQKLPPPSNQSFFCCLCFHASSTVGSVEAPPHIHSVSLIYLCFFPNSCLHPENPASSPSKSILYFFALLLIICLSIS